MGMPSVEHCSFLDMDIPTADDGTYRNQTMIRLNLMKQSIAISYDYNRLGICVN